MLVHLKRAMERIFYQEFIDQFEKQAGLSQQLLFPVSVNLEAGEIGLLDQVKEDLVILGFDIEKSGLKTLVVKGLPVALNESDVKEALDGILDALKNQNQEVTLMRQKNLAIKLAVLAANKHHTALKEEERNNLIDRLFGCENPYLSPQGKSTVVQLSTDDLEKYFE